MTADSEQQDPPPISPAPATRKRRRFQFSLASLFVVMTVAAVAFRFPVVTQALFWIAAASLALLLAVLVAFIVFLLFFYLPTQWLLERLSGRESGDVESPSDSEEVG